MSKYEHLEKSTVLLENGQKFELDKICREINEWRKDVIFIREKERITSNMLIRCLVKHFINKFPYTDEMPLCDEKMVHTWMTQIFKKMNIAQCMKKNPEYLKKSLENVLK
jgi:hypothetical protein